MLKLSVAPCRLLSPIRRTSVTGHQIETRMGQGTGEFNGKQRVFVSMHGGSTQ
jgi:hypothetical protein